MLIQTVGNWCSTVEEITGPGCLSPRYVTAKWLICTSFKVNDITIQEKSWARIGKRKINSKSIQYNHNIEYFLQFFP